MSEDNAEYVTDASIMLGAGYASVKIEPPRKVLERSGRGEFTEVDNPAWIKFSTAFKYELPDIDGNALKVWIYIALSVNYKGEAFPAIQTIAKSIGLSHTTVIAHIKNLEAMGLLTVKRGERRVNIYNIADDYVKIGRGEPVKKLDSSPQTSTDIVPTSKENSPTSKASFTLTRRTRINKKDFLLSKDEIQDVIKSANLAVDKMLEMNKDAATYWKGRELIRPDLLGYADWYNGATNQVMTKRVQGAWWKALAEWKDEALSVEALQEAYKHKSEWSIVSDPNQLTKDAVAINRAILAKPLSPTVPIYNPTTDEEDYVPAPPRK
jgi:DNA-binding transcriptional regulator GbsR (MarR family)